MDSEDASEHILGGVMARKKAENIKDRIADAVEKEIRKNENQTTLMPEEDERRLDDELDFDNLNFGDIAEDNYDD